MYVRFWGVRGSIPTPGTATIRYGGNTPCVEIRCGDTLIILDAGSGIRELGSALMLRDQPVHAHLLVSHTHWDHIQGLPFFVPLYVNGNRIHIYGCRGATSTLEDVLTNQMELPYFPVTLSDVSSQVTFHELDEGQFPLDDARVKAIFANHPGVCLMYRIEWRGKSVVYMCDNEPYHQLASPLEAANVDPRLARFALRADLLIVDCAYTAEEYFQRRGWGHGCVDDVVRIGVESNAKRMALFHHDPSHADDRIDAMVEHARSLIAARDSTLECIGAREGLEVNL